MRGGCAESTYEADSQELSIRAAGEIEKFVSVVAAGASGGFFWYKKNQEYEKK